MPRRIPVTTEMVDWLRQAHSSHTPITEMAAHFGLHPDTIKRLLHRHEIRVYEGAKYGIAAQEIFITWTRPCSGCGTTKPRPKWTYYCDACKRRLGHDTSPALT